MYLLFVISLLSFLIAFTKSIVQPIQRILLKDSKHVSSLKQELVKLKKELKLISMKDDYIAYVRIERQITKLEIELGENIEAQSMHKNLINYGLNYGLKFILGFALFIIVVMNRSEPVIIFSDRFNFAPFSSIMSLASKFDNSISTPFWIFINNYVFRQLASEIK
ncbi:hypothetical protein ACKWTF_012320 [Chironomus riparius]